MRLVHISTTDHGGAGNAAWRIHRACRSAGDDSTLLVAERSRDDPSVLTAAASPAGKARLKVLSWLNSRDGRPGFSPSRWCGLRVSRHPLVKKADAVALYWIADGFADLADLADIRVPVLWRLSDLWPFTGGCHYPGTCEGYRSRCDACPLLQQRPARGFAIRERAWRAFRPLIVAPSRWIAGHAARSSLFGHLRIEVVHTGVDLSVYRPIDRRLARTVLGLDPDRTLLGFAAQRFTADPRKGFSHLVEALRRLAVTGVRPELLAWGGPTDQPPGLDLPLPVHWLGMLHDERLMALCYAACDAVVVPSLEDNLPNTALEALACGTPVAGFSAGGLADAVDSEVGSLAATADADGLARSIGSLLSSGGVLGQAARRRAEERFDLRIQAGRIRALLTELTEAACR